MARARVAALAAAAVIGVVCWHHWSATTPKATRPAELPIAGAVLLSEVGGGIPSATSSDSGLLPIRSVPVLVRGVTVSGRRLQRRLRADRHGRFRMKLPPGSYTFTAILDQGSTSVADQPNTTVRVRVGPTGRPLPVRIIDTEAVTKIV